ncbi:MAG: prepilin-type N-terminal cleavage/methylation domain-containing protein [Burkholderiales bacterium]|nr:prepilin-type N-terminal cleavage/methylation domain-containing protein [Burkholderiales bacterium]
MSRFGRRPAESGVSLIEALVAMAVMAFGMLGIVGIQASLRLNADIAKQRTEAVQIAEQALENARSFTLIDATPATGTYDGIANTSFTDSTITTTNATYTVQITSSPDGSTNNLIDPPFKAVTVKVSWTDRAGLGGIVSGDGSNSVVLDSIIPRVMPEVGATLSLPAMVDVNGGPLRLLKGRNPLIPPDAVNQQLIDPRNHTSIWTLPLPGAATQIQWIFDNLSGVIVSLCTGPTGAAACTPANALLLSGYINFALATPGQPTAADSENPTSPPPAGYAPGVNVNQFDPTKALDQRTTTNVVACVTQQHPPAGTSALAYYCAVPIQVWGSTSSYPSWSGQSVVTGLPIATGPGDYSAGRYRICNYTPVSLSGNLRHPSPYLYVETSLLNQSFLVIPAGDGVSMPYSCNIADATSSVYVDGTTQPNPGQP